MTYLTIHHFIGVTLSVHVLAGVILLALIVAKVVNVASLVKLVDGVGFLGSHHVLKGIAFSAVAAVLEGEALAVGMPDNHLGELEKAFVETEAKQIV